MSAAPPRPPGTPSERRQMADDRTLAYAEALFEVARAEGTLGEVEDELFRFSQTLQGNDELRDDAHRPGHPGQPAPADRRGPAGRQGVSPTTVALVSMVVGTGRARDLPAIIRQLVEMSAAEANKEVAEVRSAVAAHRRPARAARQGAGRGHRQAGRGQGRRRPVGAGRHRRPGRRHRHRRVGPQPARQAEERLLEPTRTRTTPMAELTINTADIAAALRKNLEDFKPGVETAQVGRVIEVGDGIATVSGLPERGGQRAARVRGRRRRPRPQPRRGVDRRRRARRRGRDRGGPGGQGDRPHPVGAGRRRPARPGRRRPRQPDRRQGPAHQRGRPPHGDPGARHHGPQAGARAAADRHQGHRRHDADRPGPARADHRRPQDRQDHRSPSTRSSTSVAWA